MKTRQSTTCDNCRARKLACDGKRPECSQCQRSARKCPGYEHDLIFRAPVTASSFATNPKTRRRRCRSVDEPNQGEPSSSVVQSSRHSRSLPPSLTWPLLDIISLVVRNFVPGREIPQFFPTRASAFSQRVCGGWVEVLPDLVIDSQSDQYLSPAIKTLALSILAQDVHGRVQVSEVLASHASALESLIKELDHWTVSSRENLTAAIMCFFLSEKIIPTSATSDRVHAKGIEDLMQFHRPESYASGVAHHLFVGFRPIFILEGFTSRDTHFLSDPAWTSTPFSFYNASPLQALFTEVFPLTSILGGIDALNHLPAEEAIPNAQKILEELGAVYKRISYGGHGLRVEDTVHQWSPTFPIRQNMHIQFPCMFAANSLTHLWAFQSICIHNMLILLSTFPGLSVPSNMGVFKNAVNLDTITRFTCWNLRSMEFLLQEEFKLFGAASTSFPLKTACEMRKAHDIKDPEIEFWHHRVAQIIQERGYHFLESMMDV